MNKTNACLSVYRFKDVDMKLVAINVNVYKVMSFPLRKKISHILMVK